jgi:hypothetical protein
VALKLEVAVEGTAPYVGETRIIDAPQNLPGVGETIYLRVDPADRSQIAPEARAVRRRASASSP